MEGPSIVILKEEAQLFKGKEVITVSGNSKIDQQRLLHRSLEDIKSWGKHFILCFGSFSLRVHFMMFGSYRINEEKEAVPRLSLRFENGVLNLYSCSVRFIEGDLDKIYDWKVDILSDAWDETYVRKLLHQHRDEQVGDVLLDQDLFAGVGNIIKNEVLFRIHVHPESILKALPESQLDALIREARNYSFDFLRWKRQYVLKKHWQAYNQKNCPRCNTPLTRKHTGERPRRSFFCAHCQELYK